MTRMGTGFVMVENLFRSSARGVNGNQRNKA